MVEIIDVESETELRIKKFIGFSAHRFTVVPKLGNVAGLDCYCNFRCNASCNMHFVQSLGMQDLFLMKPNMNRIMQNNVCSGLIFMDSDTLKK